jgi:TPR repeat protein
MGLNQHSRQGSVVIKIEMGAADLTSLVMAALAEVEAFFELGMKYAPGRSGPTDLVAVHKWFNVAFARGYRTAASFRRELAREMLAEEIAAAQREARLFLTRH